MAFFYTQLFVKPPYPDHSFAGQTIIVTGSNTGLGKEAARHFARLDAAKIIIAARNVEAGEAARQDILASTHRDPSVLEVWKLDLSSYESVKAFASRAQRDLSRIDVLLENAGIAAGEYNLSEGWERTLTVNVISTFLLALLLLPKLQQTAQTCGVQPRLTFVSSEVHGHTAFAEQKAKDGLIFKTLSDRETANMDERYPTSKLLEVLVIKQLAPKITKSNVIVNMLNPGLCQSGLSRDTDSWGFWAMKLIFARTTEVGSRTLVASAAAGPESHGMYMSDGVVKDHDLSPFVQSEEGEKTGKRVWAELKQILEKIQSGVTKGL